MRWHVTGNEKASRKLKDELKKIGDDVAARWLRDDLLQDDDDDPAEAAMAAMDDIAKSHGLIYAIGKGSSEPISETALGIAIALNKRVVLIGTARTEYHRLPTIERYGSVKEFITTREDEKNVDV
jgi:hypothetical protein